MIYFTKLKARKQIKNGTWEKRRGQNVTDESDITRRKMERGTRTDRANLKKEEGKRNLEETGEEEKARESRSNSKRQYTHNRKRKIQIE